jgi:hypothetical protein
VHHLGAHTSTKFVPVPGELSFALSGQFSSAFAVLPPLSNFRRRCTSVFALLRRDKLTRQVGETSRRDKQRIRVNSRKSRFPAPQTRGTFLPFALGKNKAKG